MAIHSGEQGGPGVKSRGGFSTLGGGFINHTGGLYTYIHEYIHTHIHTHAYIRKYLHTYVHTAPLAEPRDISLWTEFRRVSDQKL